jgi:hypothetical protein
MDELRPEPTVTCQTATGGIYLSGRGEVSVVDRRSRAID